MVNYIGNKGTLTDFITPHIPKNIPYYIEPFGGMMGIFFTLNLKDFPDTQFIYNDVNPLNSNLFEHLKKEKFIQKVNQTNVTESLFLESYDNLKSKSKDLRALSWLIILCCGEVKDLMSKKYGGNSQFEILKWKLPRYESFFNRLTVLNLDYKKLFEKYDNGADVFFYCDPIYKGYESYYTNHNWSDVKHFELYSHLSKLKSSWILSYYNFPELKEWYKDYKIISTKHNLGIEYLILKGPTLI